MAHKRGDVFNINASINEYMFARIIEDHNLDVREHGGRYITAKQGRELHKAWIDYINAMPNERSVGNGTRMPVLDENGQPEYFTLNTVTTLGARQALSAILGPHLNENNPWYDAATARPYAQGYIAEWVNHTGIAASRRDPARDERERNGVRFATNNVIPISPFDEDFANRETVLSHGTEILWARPDDIISQARGVGGIYGFMWNDISPEAQFNTGLNFYELQYRDDDGRRAAVDERTTTWVLREAGDMATQADVAGITRLREFMNDREFRAASRWMERIPADRRMTPEMTERSVAILEMLRDNGIPYSIKTDLNPGQLKANIGNTKLSIRVTDVRSRDGDNGLYIGRVYNDGNAVTVVPRNAAQRRTYVPSVEDTLNVIRYSMGESVNRNVPRNARTMQGALGSPSSYQPKPDGTPADRTTYFTRSTGANPGKPQLVAFYGMLPDPTVVSKGRTQMMYLDVKVGNNHSSSHLNFPDNEQAESFLKEAISTARDNFERKVNIDYLVAEFEANGDDPDYVPLLSGDSSISPIQLTYWNVLRGSQELYAPDGSPTRDHSFDALFEALNITGEDDKDAAEDFDVETEYDYNMGAEKYQGDPEQIIRAHLRDNVNLMFGDFEPDENGIRFSPSLVASFMESAHGTARNKDNLVSAMRTLGFTGDELRGDDFETGTVKDKLLRFNPENARPMQELAEKSPYMKAMLDTIVTTLRETACEVDPATIMIDDSGVVRYEADMQFGRKPDKLRHLQGEIGQIFEPDADGILETKYNGSANKLLTPGYEVYIVPETDENRGEPLETRYRFRGLPQILHDNIQQQLRYDVHNIEETIELDNEDIVLHTGTTTSLNNTYRGLYHTGYKVSIEQQEGETLKDTYIRQMEMTHMPKDVLSAIFQTARGMVHFDKEILEGSSVNAEYRADLKAKSNHVSVHELTNDNVQDPYELTGHANMAITAENSDRLFDPVMTGSGKNQGGIRYFVEGAGVNPDGTAHFAEESGRRAPIVNMADQQFADYIPADRQQMSLSNYMTASGVAGSKNELDDNSKPSRGIGVAQLTLQGLTFDDGAVISKAFAEKYKVIDEHGELRPLMAGDKLCDQAGNKSVIAKVIDPNMPPEEAAEKKLDLAVRLFKDNPTLDVVQAPYSAVSRFNAAGMRHAMNNPDPLKLPDGSIHPGCIGFVPMTVTHHTAEDHTKMYDDDDVKQGKGRKVSTQQSWMLNAKGAVNMLREIYEPNNNATVNMREYLNTLGYDMSETGKIRFGYTPHNGESRFIFKLPEDETIETMSEKDIAEMFGETVGARGGFMELPFPLQFPSGETTQVLDKAESSNSNRDMYMFPVMSSHLRSGQTFEDGTKATHDYTNQYQSIYRNAVTYLKLEKELSTAPNDKKEAIQNEMNKAVRNAQQSYNSIADDVFARKFESKHNIARDELMARRMPNSATAIWTPDPTLGVNQVAMSPSIAATLGVKDGDRCLINRDPLLRVYGMRDLEVVVDETLHGIAIPPAMAMSYDGDFDGDSAGANRLRTKAAQEESYRLFSFEQNMLDYARVRENGDYALMFNDSMDVISAEAIDEERRAKAIEQIKANNAPDKAEELIAQYPPTLRERRMQIEHEFNEVYKDTSLTSEERIAKNEELTAKLSQYARDVMVPQIATELISYNSPQEHMESLIRIVDHGAKGSMKKLDAYMKYAGFTAEHDENGRILADTVKDVGHTLATAQDIRDTELATAIKSHGTGNAGAVSQRVVTLLRNRGLADEIDEKHGQKVIPQNALEGALRLSYLATQGILQAKHDPAQAKMLYSMINSDIRSLWKGYSLDRKDDPETGIPHWTPRYENGKPVQATPEEWVKTFMDMHTAKNGLDLGGTINEDDVKACAAALTDENGFIMNIENDEVINTYASSIDILAYRQGNARDILKQMATDNRQLFDGAYSQYFAPSQIRSNMKAEAEGRLEDLRPLQPADTKAVHNVISNKKAAIDITTKTLDDDLIKGKDLAEFDTSFSPEVAKISKGNGSFDFSKSAVPSTQTAFNPIQLSAFKDHVVDLGFGTYDVTAMINGKSGHITLNESAVTQANGQTVIKLESPTYTIVFDNETETMTIDANELAGYLSEAAYEASKAEVQAAAEEPSVKASVNPDIEVATNPRIMNAPKGVDDTEDDNTDKGDDINY